MNNNSSDSLETVISLGVTDQLFEQAIKLYNSGRLQETQECLTQILNIDSANEKANLMCAQILMDTQKFEDAIMLFQKIINLNSMSIDAYFYCGIAYFKTNKIENSLKCMDLAIKIKPDDYDIWFTKGNIYFRINELENAVNCYIRTIEINPAFIDAYKELSSIYYGNKDFNSALTIWDKAINANPENELMLCLKGDLYKNMNVQDKAAECYQNAIALNPKCAIAYGSLGILKHSEKENFQKDYQKRYINNSNIDEAIILYEKAIEADPGYDLPYFNLGLAYLKLNCLDEALYNFKRYISIKAHNPEAWYHKSMIEEKLHLYNEAMFSLRKLVAAAERNKTPENVEYINAAYQRANILMKLEYENTPMLNKYGKDITRLAAIGNIGPYFGREKELMQITQILSSRFKNDVLVIGEPGVGKSALIEALASEIILNGSNHILSGYRIIELNFGMLFVNDTTPVNLLAVLKEAEENSNIILFIDDMHKIINYSDILKPAIENSKLIFITTTNLEGYQKLDQFDTVLERKFEKLMLNEPSREETIEILTGIKDTIEAHHKVQINPAAIESAVDLSIKFVSERKLPDKAIDAIDKACAMINIQLCSTKINERYKLPANEQTTVSPNDIAQVISQKTSIPYEIIAGNVKVKNNSLSAAGQNSLPCFLKNIFKGRVSAL